MCGSTVGTVVCDSVYSGWRSVWLLFVWCCVGVGCPVGLGLVETPINLHGLGHWLVETPINLYGLGHVWLKHLQTYMVWDILIDT